MSVENIGEKPEKKMGNNEETIKNIKELKNKFGSWRSLAAEIYRIKEDYSKKSPKTNERPQKDRKEIIINAFAKTLEKAIRTIEAGERKNRTTIKLNGKTISFKEILSHLQQNNTSFKGSEYIKANTDILYKKRKFSEKFAEEDLEKVKNDENQGHKEAQTTLGHFYYYYGENKIRNVKKALELYKLAAEQGDHLALYQLGLIYEYGDTDGNIEPNKEKSYKYYKQSAEKNFPLALNKLAYYHYAKKEWKDFFTCAKKAKERGDVIGTLYLAHAYQEGLGTNENIKEAISLYQNLTGNEEAVPYRLEILWTLVILHKKLDTPAGQNDSKLYFNKFFNFLKQWIEKELDDNNVDLFNQFFNTNPDRYNRILAAAHHDYVHNPKKPSVISALFSSD